MRLLICLFLVGVLFCVCSQPALAKNEIYINLWDRTLKVQDKGKVIKTYRINPDAQNIRAIKQYRIGPGTKDTPTPVGIFTIVVKKKNWYNGFGSRWMQLSVPWGTFGIHGTNKPYSIGGYVSEGCIRMYDQQVEELYELVDIGTKVTIDGPLTGHPDVTYRVLVCGSRGALVKLVQHHLQAAGFYKGECNGIFDQLTEKAVVLYQKQQKLPVTAQIHYEDLLRMGIIE
ncbi:L,D-transpeptidase family protein [Aneurinibacillus sp. Ricciae_BoGa-3]|uniref:L,D-transpeptidase family protein n=1 Tax=Aneurinibacillus sp. Ricciae_BoGa-3 TaxID=3022697 RepID=UPI0023416610|nr:L,D-transpeptidase family protein [Aneurinibacillus sp. Ricciae_BoGa-3]WCK55061.1 L,D-transpeptidase family protein [Aneurinibacillus sp. Ricciae_BoGa-3]